MWNFLRPGTGTRHSSFQLTLDFESAIVCYVERSTFSWKDEEKMRRFVVFEDTVYPGKFHRAFFRFCLARQIGLIRELPRMWALGLLYFLGLIRRERYLGGFWRFLGKLREPEKLEAAFFRRKGGKLFLPDRDAEVLSAHPAMVLEGWCRQEGISLIANAYDPQTGRFESFRLPGQNLPEGEYAAYGGLHSRILKNAARKYYICDRWITLRKGDCVLQELVTWCCLVLFGAVLGLFSLYYASQAFALPTELFGSYLRNPLILALNLAPPVVMILLFYFWFDSAAAAAGAASLLTMIPTWINHYKLLFRDDPFLFEDIRIAMEAKTMSQRYQIVIGTKMILVAAVLAFGVALMAFFCRGKIRNARVRGALLLATAVLAAVGFQKYYLSGTVYYQTRNLTYINQWSTTQQFQSRGFWYPFLHSVGDAVDREPEGYSEAEAKEILEGFAPEDIPAEKRVNVISVMLEAYGDFRKFDTLEFTNDPYESMDRIAAESYTGNLVTNIFAAGTINTERCFISGLSTLPSFRRATDSHAWFFRDQGYTVEGSHPCYNWFYNRQNVNPNLGFQNYYFDEDTYMALNNGYHCSVNGILFPQIVKQFEEAAARGEDYFSFSVTYEGHGPYADDVQFEKEYLANDGWTESTYNTLNNYFALMEDVNLRLVEMIDSLRDNPEPVVVILFGDHMPWMGNGNSIYHELGLNIDVADDTGFLNYYQTPYLIWANDAAKQVTGNDFRGKGPAISPCFLMNEFYRLAGYTGDAYAMYAGQVAAVLPVINDIGVCMDPEGNVLRTLTGEQQALLEQFLRVQYYRRNLFTGK